MKHRGLSQEGLKGVACAAMLIDHIGATVLLALVQGGGLRAPYDLYWLARIVGRVAFPIYCFLLAEGADYTRGPWRYALRLAVGVALAELPFDLAFNGGWDMGSQSVMLTLLLGYLAILAMKRLGHPLLRLLVFLPFAALAEACQTDYGGSGVLLIALFALTREAPHRRLWQLAGLTGLSIWVIPGAVLTIGQVRVPVELFAVAAMLPIACYHGRKATANPALQWAFYLFYPVHLAVLAAVTWGLGAV